METATQLLHRLTSLAPFESDDKIWEPPVADDRVVMDLVVNDIDRLPWFFKHYPDRLDRVPLPRELPSTSVSTVDLLAGIDSAPSADLDLAQLGRVLHLSAGVVRVSERRYGDHLFRAAGSAGGRFPLELYVAIPVGGALPPGVHWYHPQEHALVTIGPPPPGDVPTAVVTGVPWRTGWRYRERGFRHVYWDAGTMLSQLLAAADSAGLQAALWSRFPDDAVAALVGADGTHEWPVAVVALGPGSPVVQPAGPAVAAGVDSDPVEFPLVTAAQHAGDIDAMGDPWPRGAPADVTPRTSPPVEDVVLARGSQRLMDPTRSLSADVLRTSLTAALRGIEVPHWVAVHRVDGVEPGIYRSDDLDTPVHKGDVQDEMYHASLDQALGRDAAFVVIAATDVAALDDRSYREAHLAAGLVEGRLHLLAYAQGATATGMTFSDPLVPPLLGARVDPLLFTCVGVAEYKSRPGGLPGAPSRVGLVTPRM